MRFKLKFVTLFFLFTSNFVFAQNTLDNVGLTSATPASVAYSLRQLSTSYTGPLVRVKVGVSFYDVYPDASTKKFSLSSKISSSISTYNAAVSAASADALSTIISGSTEATVAIWYDQSGNGIHVLSSGATAKIITAGSILTMSGQPTINFHNSTSYLTSSSNVNYSSQSWATVNAVAQNVACDDALSGIISVGELGDAAGFSWGLNFSPAPITWVSGYWVDASGGTGAMSGENSSDPKVVTALIQKNTNSSIYVNSSLKGTKSAGTNDHRFTSSDVVFVGTRGTYTGRYFKGNISETMIFPKNLSNTEQAALESSQSAFLPPPPSVTITSSASGAVCAGTTVTFTATVTGISTPTYQWTKNGIGIPGANSSTYSSTTLSNNDVIKVWVNAGINNSAIVSNGLLLNLDASNPGSYSGTGNKWYDLSGNNNHATLMNSPTYDAASKSIVTNGTNQYLTIPNLNTYNSNITMQAWIYFDGSTRPGALIGAKHGYSIGKGDQAYDQSGNNLVLLLYGAGGWKPTWQSYGSSGWKLVTMTLDGSSTARAYIDGTLKYTYTGTAPSAPLGDLNLGAIPEDGYRYYDGKFAAAYFYNRALSLAEIQQNYDAFATKSTGYGSNTITVAVTGAPPALTVTGDGCASKTTLSTTSGLTSYAWYKDNVAINGATSNVYTPTSAGVYKVEVTTGSCSSTSTTTTINTCGNNAYGKMVTLTSSIISPEGGANFGTGKDVSGKIFNTTNIASTSGIIGTTTAVLGGVISSTAGLASSVGIIYSTDVNFGTYSTTTIQSNVAAGTYTSTISGLSSSTNYYAKSFIVNKAGITYGSIVNFTTTAPSLVSDGLVLNLDAGNTSSYSGTGTTWTDLSGKGNHGTLYNSVSYNSSNSGSLVFNGNGTNDGSRDPYVQLPMSTDFDFGSGDFTVEMWAYTTSGNIASDFVVINSASSSYAAVRLEYYNGDLLVLHSYDGVSHASGGASASFAFNLNVWNHIVVSRISGTAKVYVNGVEKASYSLPGSLLAQQNSRIGSLPTHPGGKNYSGNIATTRFYKGKGLTAAEISYNFNLLKSRFGL